MSEKEKDVQLSEKEQAVLDAITKKIDAQVEQKADKKSIDEMNEKLNTAIQELTNFKGEVNFEIMQKQLDKLFERTEQIGNGMSAKRDEVKEREITQKWVRSFLKRDKEGLKKAEAEHKDYMAYFTHPCILAPPTTRRPLPSKENIPFLRFCLPKSTVSSRSLEWHAGK